MTRFLKHFLLASALGLLGLPLLTWIVDPLGGFHDFRIAGFNANKPAAVSPKRETKALWIRKARPDAILLGSSRVLLGLDPAHPALSRYQPFNFAITGAKLGEMEAQLRYAQKIRPLRLAIIGLDFYAFNGLDNDSEKSFPFLELPYWKQVAKILWSLESLEFVGKTLGRQHVKPNRWLENNGLMRANVEALKLSDRKSVIALPSEYSPKLCGYKLYDTLALRRYEQILNYAHTQNIELMFFIPPVHAWLTEGLYAQEMDMIYADWKRELVRINEMAAAHLKKPAFAIWDFSGYSRYTTEPLPTADSEKMQYYYDGSHFSPALGDYVLRKMMGYGNPETMPGFGRLLTSKTLADALANENRERRIFLSSSHVAGEIGEFNEAINKILEARAKNCPPTP